MLGEKAAEDVSDARDLTSQAAEVIVGSTEITLADLGERTVAPPLQPPAEARSTNEVIADR
jgi:hypothetical protein